MPLQRAKHDVDVLHYCSMVANAAAMQQSPCQQYFGQDVVSSSSKMTVNNAPSGSVYVLNLEVWISVTHNLIAVSWALLPTSSQVRNLMTPKAELQTGPSGRDDAVGSRKRPSFYISRVGFWHRRTPLVHA